MWGGIGFFWGALLGQKLLPRRLRAAVPPYAAQPHAHVLNQFGSLIKVVEKVVQRLSEKNRYFLRN